MHLQASKRSTFAAQVGLAASLATFIVFQTLATLYYNLPPNYTTKTFDSALNHYMQPYLTQSWSLFAPNPGQWNPSCFVRYAIKNASGKYEVTKWLDGNALFAKANSSNPLDRLGLEREIYFSEILIATNDIAAIRANIRGRSLDPARPTSIKTLTPNMLPVERLFMAMAPELYPQTKEGSYVVQVAMREELAVKFDERYPKSSTPNVMHPSLNEVSDASDTTRSSKIATLVMPWVLGEHLSGFVDSVSR